MNRPHAQSCLSVSVPATLLVSCVLAFCATQAIAQTGPNPSRWQAQDTQIYFDSVSTIAPSLGPGFILDAAGSLTSNPSEVIAGNESIKGSYFGSGTYTPYLQTDPSIIPLSPSHSYQVTFQYKILTAPSSGFEVLFYSPTGGAAGNFLPSVTVAGQAGTTGTATLTNTLGPYTDYQARWDIPGTGAISIDNIQLTDVATGKVIASENAQGTAPTVGPGLQLQNGASVVTDPTLVVSGQASIRLTNYGTVATNPATLPLSGRTIYIVQLQYRILNPGSSNPLHLWLQPAGTVWSMPIQVDMTDLLANAPVTDTFSAGAQTAGADRWVLNIAATSDSDVVVDNITIFRQDSVSTGAQPSAWSNLDTLPYPRLGEYMLGTTVEQAEAGGLAEGPRLRLSVDQVEGTLAFADVIFGIDPNSQTESPDSIRRLRALNPNAVILPYRISEEQQQNNAAPTDSDTDLEYLFLQGVADPWYLRDSKGNYVPDPDYPYIRKMNISSFSPLVNGQNYFSFMLNWLNQTVFPSGEWDGVFFDNLFGTINPHILNYSNPALIDVDYEGNGNRETPAWVSNMSRSAATSMLQQLRNTNGDLQLVIGNTGPMPELNLAPWVNGYLFECMNTSWNASYAPNWSPATWRTEFEAYRTMQSTVRLPRINVLEGCGPYAVSPGQGYSVPTAPDLQNHRLTMGTALLNSGFYEYALHGSLSAPLWFDEYSVDSTGTAVQDRTKKGYLGQALTDASELTGPGTLVLQEGFENGVLPPSFLGNPSSAVSITQTAGEVISGTGSLVINNPDYMDSGYVNASTNPSVVPLAAGSTYLLVFDWRILETLDNHFQVSVFGNDQNLDFATIPGVVAGDSGTAWFPVTIPAAGNWMFAFAVVNGGGKVAIDNVRIYQGGAGPWRRDFESGFVLVNPFTQAHTFSAADLAGVLNRTGIKRINGTQAPNVNNGQPVTGSLTLGAFDAIILLADPIDVRTPLVNGVSNAAGGQQGIASGSFVSIYGSSFTPLPYDDWTKAIASGQLPTQLDGITVSIGGKPAYINVITPSQINVQAPDVGAASVQVTVTGPGGTSAAFTANSQLYSPAFFEWPGNQPVATHADYSLAAKNGTFPGTTTVPAKPGETVILWGTGFGPTNPVVPAGQEPTVQAPPTQAHVSVTLGGIAVPVTAAVLSGYAAEYQIAIQIPASMADGGYPIVATVNGVLSPSNIVLTVQH